jgi:hypothetical protein
VDYTSGSRPAARPIFSAERIIEANIKGGSEQLTLTGTTARAMHSTADHFWSIGV